MNWASVSEKIRRNVNLANRLLPFEPIGHQRVFLAAGASRVTQPPRIRNACRRRRNSSCAFFSASARAFSSAAGAIG